VPSLSSAAAWPVEAPFYAVVVAAALYVLGGRRRRTPTPAWRTASFVLGLAAVLVALDSPLAAIDDTSFAAHMAQHVLLIAVAPPLLVLAAPWMRLWQPLPLRSRRSVARALALSRAARPLRSLAHLLGRPLPAWILAGATLLVWHVPALYDLTLRSSVAHESEHGLFFATGLLFWSVVLDSPPFRAKLGRLARAAYVTSGMLVGWVLAVVLAFAPSPLYPAYAALPHRPGGLTALADQQLAAGVMWVPGSLAATIATIVFFYRWLDPAPTDRRRLELAGGS
jgi:cytochrome c oxidase assembly factor CtaG